MRKVLLVFMVLALLTALSMKPAHAEPVLPFDIGAFFRNFFKGAENENIADPRADPDALLPDLKVAPPDELEITIENGQRTLRFSTIAINDGIGSLEVIGNSNAEKRITQASQVLHKKDGSVTDRKIGAFIFHPDHKHWHIENFTEFQLWSVNRQNEPEELIATTDKMSFCLWDEMHHNADIENSPEERQFPAVCDSDTQGISPGWSDKYGSSLPGQALSIEGIPDGTYFIRSTINPDRKIVESNYANNSTETLIELNGSSVRKTEKPLAE